MDFFSAMEIVSSGLTANRVRLNVTASNLANANTTRTPEGGPYKRRDPMFESLPMQDQIGFRNELDRAMIGVHVTKIVKDVDDPRLVYDPQHPDANEKGYVALPNVNMVEEMVNMVTASRAYEAGVTAMKSVKEMADRALQIGK